MKTSAIIASLVVLSMLSSALAITPLEKVNISEPGLVNRIGAHVGKNINVNQQVLISSKITNMQETPQDFIYIVQIKNENENVVKIDWFTGSLTKFQNFVPAVSWVPTTQETFTVEIYVWDGLDPKKHKYEALAESIKFSVIVS